ncbi:heat-inducible transcriptional repressor HrcA [Peptoniphilus equinus]|uniref:Heat-inducible transcription repressor HrcA n=1 Tax=Peptoniphilus equinus TaxID=3016343 RepID=A0ABY7QUA0_9FIRM|nr:heat-inducible transcriptional repressor HrcA [Peptoniphilus equinus]WBW50362.1 heat-inducible transcriptional repressor HrcA [Peptoniphilus equinus]
MDSRKEKILNAIIRSYIESAMPVGSRTLQKGYDFGVSSATIRNEMADLEDLGYLNKPHTSAGRIPSSKAYRFYVDELNRHFSELGPSAFGDEEESPLKGTLKELYHEAVERLAEASGYIAYVITEQRRARGIKLIQIIPMDRRSVLLLVVGNRGAVEKHFLPTAIPMDDDTARGLSAALNSYFSGVDLADLDSFDVYLRGEAGRHKDLVELVTQRISAFDRKEKKVDFYYSGLKNVFNFKDALTQKEAFEIMALVEGQDFKKHLSDFNDNLCVVISDEDKGGLLKDNAIILARFGDEHDVICGKLGILGPQHLDYEAQIKNVVAMSRLLNRSIDKLLR